MFCDAQRQSYERMSLAQLRNELRYLYPEHQSALKIYTKCLIDLEVERRLNFRHQNVGWQSLSSIALIGLPRYRNNQREPMFLAYNKSFGTSVWHQEARTLLNELSSRRLIALLIRHVKQDHRRDGDWAKTYDQIAFNIEHYCLLLGFEPQILFKHHYQNGQVIKNEAQRALMQLLKICEKRTCKIETSALI